MLSTLLLLATLASAGVPDPPPPTPEDDIRTGKALSAVGAIGVGLGTASLAAAEHYRQNRRSGDETRIGMGGVLGHFLVPLGVVGLSFSIPLAIGLYRWHRGVARIEDRRATLRVGPTGAQLQVRF